jgi:transposase
MAKQRERIIVGIDTAKAELEFYRKDTEQGGVFANEPGEVDRFLESLPEEAEIAIESTGRLHELLVLRALELGVLVYIISGFQLSRYRDAVGQRAKTDRSDARLLARFLEREGENLRPVTPRSPEEKRLWQLLRRRASIVHHRTALQQSLRETDAGFPSPDALLDAFKHYIAVLEREALRLAKTLGWREDLDRLQSTPGVGPISALGLLLAFRHAPFRNADAYIAFMGLDVRVRDSGKFKGKRRLTKKGEPELRRLAFLAGRAGRRAHAPFKEYFDRMLERGYSKIAADVAVGRKIARIAFALLRDGRPFGPSEA